MFYQAYLVNGATLPFISNAKGSTQNPFLNAPGLVNNNLTNQLGNFSTFGVDAIRVDYMNTQAPIQKQGRNMSYIYYDAPNGTWMKSNTGVYNTSAISLGLD